MRSRQLPLWKRWMGIASAALMLIVSFGPSAVMAASAVSDGTIETGSSTDQQEQEQEQLTIGVIELEANGVFR